jgi:polyhydroxybutyrate depolymerase
VPALTAAAREVTVAGAVRRYLIDAPGGAGDVPRPLVLALHGFGHSAAGLRTWLGFAERAAAGDLIAIHADGRDDVPLLNRVGRGWDIAPDETRDAAFVAALLDAVEAERCVDRRRVYATGFSNGGFFANLLACRLADRFAAIAAVAGARPLDACLPATPMPILFFHGRADRVVPLRLTVGAVAWWRRANRCGDADEVRDGCQAARGCAADVVACTGPQGHTWPNHGSDRIWDFFQSHVRRDG